MRAALARISDALAGSYWFLPAVMAMAAIVLAGAMIWIDTHVGSAWMDGLPWLYAARPDGARQVLSAIGGSMITVAGTVFSVTIASGWWWRFGEGALLPCAMPGPQAWRRSRRCFWRRTAR